MTNVAENNIYHEGNKILILNGLRRMKEPETKCREHVGKEAEPKGRLIS